jgi:hypothetical protein
VGVDGACSHQVKVGDAAIPVEVTGVIADNDDMAEDVDADCGAIRAPEEATEILYGSLAVEEGMPGAAAGCGVAVSSDLAVIVDAESGAGGSSGKREMDDCIFLRRGYGDQAESRDADSK